MKALTGILTAAALAVSLATGEAQNIANCGSRPELGRPTDGNLTVFGLTADQRLLRFKECRPDRAREVGVISGLQSPDTALVGMDYRVQDGLLYGVANSGGIYTIDTNTAQASKVSQLSSPVVLEGTVFGVDFNPAANRLRIISNTGQNLRHDVVGGVTTEDGDLNYLAPAVPPALGLTGAAYTNNDLDADTGTTLFDIDTMMNQVVIQSPPNAGTLVPTGKLFDASQPTVDGGSPVGFDIYTEVNAGRAFGNHAFASLVVGGVTSFYRMNLLTGEASLIGLFNDAVIDIAIPFGQ
jgi:hypothetical protein